MADASFKGYSFAEYTNGASKASGRRKPKDNKALVVVIGLLSLIIVLLLVLQFTVLPKLEITKVHVYGLPYEKELFLEQISWPDRLFYFAIEPRTMAASIEELSWVQEARVVQRFPDTVELYVTPRTPIALAPDANGLLYGVDGHGAVFYAPGLLGGTSLPLVTGIRDSMIAENGFVGYPVKQFFQDLQSTEEEQPGLVAAFSEFHLVVSEAGLYELMVFPVHTQVAFRASLEFSPAIAAHMLRVAEAVPRGGMEPTTVDVRSRQAILIREGQE